MTLNAMPVVKAGAFDLDYADTGCGPALVVVHASASGHRQWQLLAETLRDRYRIIAVNLFGYGKTSAWPATRPLDAADQAELVVAAADLAAGPVVLVGIQLEERDLVAVFGDDYRGYRSRVAMLLPWRKSA